MRRMGPRKRASTPNGGEIDLLTFEGDMVNRCEIFDEADLDAALARFEELQPQTGGWKTRQAKRTERFLALLRGRRLGRDDRDDGRRFSHDDRRRVVNAGVLTRSRCRCPNMRAVAEVGFESTASTVIATRGQRLALIRTRVLGPRSGPESSAPTCFGVVEIDADDRFIAAPSCSTSTTSTPPSPNSTLATSPAKRPPTRIRGR